MRDRTTPPTPSARKMSFKATTKRDATPNRVVAPAPGSAGDPTTGGSSGGGATLIVYDSAGSGEQVTVQLPASGWRMLGKAGAPKGWEFSGSDSSNPVSRVTVKADQLKVKAGKANWDYTLNEPSQGRIAVRLQLGTNATWCADAPAKSSGNPPSTASNDHVDKFTAQPKTPQPSSCPTLP